VGKAKQLPFTPETICDLLLPSNSHVGKDDTFKMLTPTDWPGNPVKGCRKEVSMADGRCEMRIK